MTDDLMKRLREVGGISDDGATRWYINPDGPEAADRIENLEAVLRDLSDGWECCPVSQAMRRVARNALESDNG